MKSPILAILLCILLMVLGSYLANWHCELIESRIIAETGEIEEIEEVEMSENDRIADWYDQRDEYYRDLETHMQGGQNENQ